MLETTATRLFRDRGGPHFGSPDKDPAVRLRVLEDAGRCNVPFTTGILIGIGETPAERAASLFAIRKVARTYHGIQEVIVQNFRAKPDTKMRDVPDAELDDLAATIAVARCVLGPKARVQAPPNLVGDQHDLVLRAGIDDWGGVSPLTPDHVNPERPWPDIAELAARTAAAGFTLRERLTIYPPYLREPWLDPRLAAHVSALADPATGLADEAAVPHGLPWQEPDGGWGGSGRTDLHVTIDTTGRTHDRRADFAEVYGDWDEIAERAVVRGLGHAPRPPAAAPSPPHLARAGETAAALRQAERDPAGLADAQAIALLSADGPDLEELAGVADALRRAVVGDDVTYVVTRNINFTNVCYTGCRFCAFAQRRTDADAYTLSLAQIGERAEEAWDAGATEVCMQGGIHPDMPGTAYFDIAAEVKRRRPGLHVHAFSPMEVVNGASRAGVPVREWLVRARQAGVDSLPGTAAEILDDEVRWVLTKGKLPASAWVEVITAAHGLGIPTTATMMYGHVDTPAHWVGHLRLIRSVQERTGGFTEFVLLPFIHENAPLYLAGLARPGPTRRENRAVHAVARLLLHGAIGSIQCSWVKLGDEACRDVLRGGANDLGGTLMEETISRMAGADNGSYKTISGLRAITGPIGRPLRQRTTTYGEVPAERLTAAAASDGVCASVRSGLPVLARLPDKHEFAGVPRRAGLWVLGRVADGDGAHGTPAVRQLQRRRRDVLAEQRAGDPRGSQPLDGERDEQVLHRRAHRHREHGLFRGAAPPVGIVVRRVGDQAGHDDLRRAPQRLPAPHPAGDLILGEPVPAQVGDPGGAHRVQQGGTGGGRLHDHEPPRLAVVRRRRGQRGGDGAAHRRAIDGLGGERPDGPAGQRHIRRPEPEHVVCGRPDQCAGPRAVGLGDQVRQPADHGDRDPQRLALHQVRGGGDLVGHGGDRDLQDGAERVGFAAVVPDRDDACGADGVVGLAVAPRPAHRVGDDHAEPPAGAAAHRLAQPPGGGVGVGRQQHHRARGRVGLIHAGRGQHQAMPGLRDRGGPAPGDHPHGLGLDGLLPRDRGHPALGLADDLGGDHEDVAVAQARGGPGDQRRQVGPGADLRQPGHRLDGQRGGPAHRVLCGAHRSSTARSSAARAMAAVAGRSRMYSGRARTSMPASPGSSAADLSVSSTSQPSTRSRP